MLTQFLKTSSEIEFLLSDNWVPEHEKMRLRRLQGQKATELHLAERDRVLEEINTKLAESILENSTIYVLNASTLGLSRIPNKILDFVRQHQTTITIVDLRNNNLVSVPAVILELPHVERIELQNNRLSQDTVNSLDKKVATDSQKEEVHVFQTTPQNTYTPKHSSVQSDGFPIGPQVPTHILPELHIKRNDRDYSCHLL
ncbi:MAG: hypothetical protein HYX61_03105 [Gammaproteobacteria bacterium]|nr:hypothetical protein [Gammaproteobacteria bacterium]